MVSRSKQKTSILDVFSTNWYNVFDFFFFLELQKDIRLKEHLVFVMKPCIAGQTSQYFFLGGVDYNTAIADYQQKKKKSVVTATTANADGEVNNMIKFI